MYLPACLLSLGGAQTPQPWRTPRRTASQLREAAGERPVKPSGERWRREVRVGQESRGAEGRAPERGQVID